MSKPGLPTSRKSAGLTALASSRAGTFLRLIVVLSLLVGTSTVWLATAPPSASEPGNPGIPGDPEMIFEERFENNLGAVATRRRDYTGPDGTTYAAHEYWDRVDQCNGILVQFENPTFPSNWCPIGTSNPRTNVRRLADALGQVEAGVQGGPSAQEPENGSTPQTRRNHAVTAWTTNAEGPVDASVFTSSRLPVRQDVTGSRFLGARIDVAEVSCNFAGGRNNSRLDLYLVLAGQEVPVHDGPIRACTDPTTRWYAPPALQRATAPIAAGSYVTDVAALVTQAQRENVQLRMRNEVGAFAGNDFAFDNPSVLDLTPQLDKTFSPLRVRTGGTSTLTLTVTNTSELAAKRGWGFDDNLPDGLTVANPTNTGGTCQANVTASAGSNQIRATDGVLTKGQRSCTITVDVTSSTPRGADPSPKTYANCAGNIENRVGIDAPGCAEVEFYSEPALRIEKTSDAPEDAQPGDVVTYTVKATNVGDGDYTSDNPARVNDDLTDVLDDATYNNDEYACVRAPGATQCEEVTAPSYAEPRLKWSGALPVDHSVEVSYSVRLKSGGNGTARNVAWVPKDNPDGQTPACNPPNEDGQDPDTGEPCAVEQYPESDLVITKSVNPDKGDEVQAGQEVTYTLTFENRGGGNARVDYDDVVSGVLDDATIENQPTASDPALTVSGTPLDEDSERYTISGSLGPDQTVTVTYSVIVNPESDRGDNRLANFLVPEGRDPPAQCEFESPTCTYNPISLIDVVKSAEPESGSEVTPGQEITYTLTFTNRGTGAGEVAFYDDLSRVLDDADVISDPESSDEALTVSPIDNGRYSVTGELEADDTVTVTYTVRIHDDATGDDVLGNFVVKEGEDPPASCEPGNRRCTTHFVRDIEVTKSSDPDSGSTVQAGDAINYTLTFANNGQASTDIAYDDVVSGVIDDADVTTQPTASDDALTVSDITEGRYEVRGNLAAGQTVTVTYAVQVKADGARGDNVLGNFVVPPGEDPPQECAERSTLCTTHRVPQIEVDKSADPADGSVVLDGETVRYTVRFRNTGAAAGDVNFDDVVTDVIDDARVTTQPAASNDALSVSAITNGRFEVRGSLAAGQTVTVTYEVRVNPVGERGNNRLSNYVVPGGEDPPEQCEAGSPLCTTHRMSAVEATKSVDPEDGSTVVAGQLVRYTLTFRNNGSADVQLGADDVVSDVLDDADVVDEPESSNPDSLAASGIEGDRFTVRGTLRAGTTVTVTYSVRVKPDGQRGNNVLASFGVLPGEDPPAQCAAGDPRCTVNPVPQIEAEKSANPESGAVVRPGERITYTLTFRNTGAAAGDVAYDDDVSSVIDDADIVEDPASSDSALTVSDINDGRYEIRGNLAAGQTVTVTYTVEVHDREDSGDDLMANFVVPPGEDPPEECAEGSTLCTRHLIADLDVVKTSDPASGSTLTPGQTVTYTLRFTNSGTAPVDVDREDVVSGVLDDATIESQPAASDDALSVSSAPLNQDSERYGISGRLAPGQEVTITYSVTVKPDGQRGDSVLGNFVVEAGEDPPENCEEGSTLCTQNAVASVSVVKSSNPESGTTVTVGDEITYTLTFRNTGAAAGDVDYDDVVSGVTDDADVTTDPAASDDALSVSAITGGRYEVRGTLQPDQTVTVSYTVRVRPADERDDSVLGNFVVPGGEDPPEQCEEGSPFCTTHEVSEIDIVKTVTNADGADIDGQTVGQGAELYYTVTITNRGAARSEVAFDDTVGAETEEMATLFQGPDSDTESVTVTADDVNRFEIRGTLAAGATAKVTYALRIRPDEVRNNNDTLSNFVVPPGGAPPAECAPGDTKCTINPIYLVNVVKQPTPDEDQVLKASDEVTYTLIIANYGDGPGPVNYDDVVSGVLDDADVVTQPSANDPALTVTEISGDRYNISGTLQPEQVVEVSYTVRVKPAGQRGDNILGNFVVNAGDDPPAQCVPGDPQCTVHRISEVTVEKSADPESGSTVTAGQSLTYTLTFRNTGTGSGPVSYDDVISDVIDDARVTSAPAASDEALTVSDVTDGRYEVRGNLDQGQTVAVTYRVEVLFDGQRGDNVIGNFVVPGGADPPEECEEGSKLCTTHLVAQVEVEKSADPESGSTVAAGDTVRYTVTFRNTGTGPGAVSFDDVVSGVTDDADVTTQPTASDDALTVSDITEGRYEVRGNLAAGDTVTVTYAVQVKADGARGDNVLGNFVVPGGEDPPQECEEGSTFCTTHLVPQVEVAKSADPKSSSTVTAGQSLTYTLTFRNTGTGAGGVNYDDVVSGVTDDADVTTQPSASDDALTVSEITDGRYEVRGNLAAGQSVTVTYAVQVKADGARGDNVLGNFAVPGGEDPPEECAEGSTSCTRHLVPQVEVAKSADPESGSTVTAGQSLTYTLTFRNTGTGAGAVNFDDVVTDVTDDADVTQNPAASDDALTVSAIADGRYEVRGNLAAGQTVTVTYKVQVRAAADRGDSVLGNFVVPGGENPPEECEEGSTTCTTHLVSQIEVAKSADPASGSSVLPGDTVDYTLTFRNTGSGPGAVSFDDVVSGVTDDADVTTQPTASDDALTVSAITDGRYEVRGNLAAGQSVTVTYAVQVKADGERGDSVLGNFVVPGGEDPPDECEEGSPTCTRHLVPQVEVAKSTNPASRSSVITGDVIRYTLTFRNTGTGAGAVSYDDVVSGVTDDADVTTQPTSSNDALTVSALTDGRYEVRGNLAAGQTITVTYEATVRGPDERGDNVLANFVVPGGEDPPQECAEGSTQCTTHSVTEIDVTKSADPASGSTVQPGQTVRYTLTFRNTGSSAGEVEAEDVVSGILDDAEIETAPQASDSALTASEIANGRFTISGTLAAGQSVDVTYAVTVKPDGERGDNALGNFVVPPGGQPPADCSAPGDANRAALAPIGEPICTMHFVPQVEVAKSSNPASGEPVNAGQKVTYTLAFTNNGTADGEVAFDDVIAGVLDDADVTQEPAASDAALTVSPISDGRFSVTGTLAAGQRVTVTYAVQIKPDGERGDNVIANYVVPPGEAPPPTCQPDNSLCTFNAIVQWELSKSSDPESGSKASPGSTIAYTLTATNTGSGILSGASAKDDLSEVIPHAELREPLPAGLSRNGETLTWQIPDVAAGESVSVTYEVTVYSDAYGAKLRNVVVPGPGPTGACVQACTVTHSTPPGPYWPGEPPPLADTGASSERLVALILATLLGGAILSAASRRRRVGRHLLP